MSFFYIEMDFNTVVDPIDNQKVTPDAGKSKHAPWNDILFELGTLRMSL